MKLFQGKIQRASHPGTLSSLLCTTAVALQECGLDLRLTTDFRTLTRAYVSNNHNNNTREPLSLDGVRTHHASPAVQFVSQVAEETGQELARRGRVARPELAQGCRPTLPFPTRCLRKTIQTIDRSIITCPARAKGARGEERRVCTQTQQPEERRHLSAEAEGGSRWYCTHPTRAVDIKGAKRQRAKGIRGTAGQGRAGQQP